MKRFALVVFTVVLFLCPSAFAYTITTETVSVDSYINGYISATNKDGSQQYYVESTATGPGEIGILEGSPVDDYETCQSVEGGIYQRLREDITTTSSIIWPSISIYGGIFHSPVTDEDRVDADLTLYSDVLYSFRIDSEYGNEGTLTVDYVSLNCIGGTSAYVISSQSIFNSEGTLFSSSTYGNEGFFENGTIELTIGETYYISQYIELLYPVITSCTYGDYSIETYINIPTEESPNPVPEPATISLISIGLLGLAKRKFSKSKKAVQLF